MASKDDGATPQILLEGFPDSLALYRAVEEAVRAIGEAEVRAMKSQIAFRRRKGFAYVWRPGQYVKNEVPVVLSLALPRRVASDRFKEVAHPAVRVWMHHLELSDTAQLDEEVNAWLTEAYENAG